MRNYPCHVWLQLPHVARVFICQKSQQADWKEADRNKDLPCFVATLFGLFIGIW